MRPLRQVPGDLRRLKLSQKFYSINAVLPCLSRSLRCLHKWNNEPLRRATPAGIPLAQPALVFISVRRGESSGEPPESLPVSGILHSLKELRSQLWLQPFRQASSYYPDT